MENTKKKRRFQPSIILTIIFVILALYTIIFLLPMVWMLLTSFKDSGLYDIYTVREDLGKMIGFNNLTFSNYVTAFMRFSIPAGGRDVYLVEMFLNSFLYAGGCAIVATMVPCIMAYLVARYRYKFGKFVYGIVLITMAIPIVGSLPSEMKMVESLGLMNTIFGLFILKANFLGIYFLVFYAVFAMIPRDYTEAAEMDGAGEFYTYNTIIMPIMIPAMATMGIMAVIGSWNNYLTPLMLLTNPNMKTLPMMVKELRGDIYRTEYGSIYLGLTLTALPLMIVYFCFSKYIIAGVAVGGVKE